MVGFIYNVPNYCYWYFINKCIFKTLLDMLDTLVRSYFLLVDGNIHSWAAQCCNSQHTLTTNDDTFFSEGKIPFMVLSQC